MTHHTTAPRPTPTDPRHKRMADLSDEYLEADANRREEIGEEIAAIIDGKLEVLR